jgi:hypothetical protein
MKKIIICFMLLAAAILAFSQKNNLAVDLSNEELLQKNKQQLDNEQSIVPKNIPPVHNLFIITVDGFRWQELFNGADSDLINSEKCTFARSTLKTLYWASTPEERRKKLMPFFWSVIGVEGQVYGNRFFDNKVNVTNAYSKSYPGYSEMFTGVIDPNISSNKKILNPNTNVFEYETRFYKKDRSFYFLGCVSLYFK